MDHQFLFAKNINARLKISIQKGPTEIILEVDRKTLLEELFDYLIDQKYLGNYKRYWICYSNISKTFLTELHKTPWIDKQEDDLMFIPTSQVNSFSPNKSDQFQNTTSTPTTEFKVQKIEEEEQHFGKQMKISLIIQDGLISRSLLQTFSENQILDKVAQSVLIYLGLDNDAASIDLSFDNVPLNNSNRRMNSLNELFPKQDYVQLTAKVRWIGG